MFKKVYNGATGVTSMVQMTAEEIAELQPGVVERRAQRSAEFELTARSAIESGFSSSALGAAHTYSSGADDQLNLIGGFQAAQIAGSVEFSCTDVATGTKAFRAHTAAQMTQVFANGVTVKLSALKRNRELQDALVAATSIEEIDALTW